MENDVLANVVYGRSAFVAAIGSPFEVVRDDNGVPFYRTLYGENGYLGQANLIRLREGMPSNPQELRQMQEMLIGDPFVDSR